MTFIRHRPSRFLLPILILAWLMVPAIAGAQADTTPPVLVSLSHTPTSIDTAGSSANVTVTVRVTDDLSGFRSGCITFGSPSSAQSRSACFGEYQRVSGTALDGVYQATVTFPQFSEAGTWHIYDGYAAFSDVIANYRSYTEAELTTAGFSTTLFVTSAQDITPPAIQALSHAPGSINVSASDGPVTVTVRITDDLAGFRSGCITFGSPSSTQSRSACFGEYQRISGTALDGIYQAVVNLPRYSEAGTWHIYDGYAALSDTIGNYRSYTESQLVDAGFATILIVESVPSDTTPPVLTSLTYVPRALNTTGGPQEVTVTVRSTDDLSGFRSGCITFGSPSGGQSRSACFGEYQRVSGTALDGTYRAVATLPQFSELGTWHIYDGYAAFSDVIGNYRSYTETELTTLGSPTTLLVTTNMPPVANAGPDGSAEVGASVVLTGSGYDPDGAGVTFEWLDDTGTVVSTAATVSVVTTLGPRTYTLRVTDSVGLIGLDTAIATGVDTTPPVVTVLTPNGGEKLFAATPYLVRWTVTDVSPISSFNVLFSSDGGTTYTPIAECTGVAGTARECIWFSPGTPTTAGRVRVVALDASANTGMDNSNLSFSVVAGAATLQVTAPSKSDDVGIGSALKLTWKHTLGANTYVRVEISRDGRETWQEVVASVKNSGATAGSYTWTVTGPLTPTARIRVTGVDVLASDMSDVDFTISPPYITIEEPSTTMDDFGYETIRTAAWVSNLGAIEKIDVALSTDGGVTCPVVLGHNILASKKKFTFAAPVLGLAAGNARLCLQWPGHPVVGMNPVDFRVAPPYVKVTFPNIASDTWTVGSTQTITWASNLGLAEKVNIELSKDGGATYPIVLAPATPADGSQSVVVQAGWTTTDAKVRISWVVNGAVKGVSSQAFRIQ